MLTLVGPTSVTAVDQDQVLAAARAANAVYQDHLDRLRIQLQEKDIERRVQAIDCLGRTLDPMVSPSILPFLDADNHPVAVVQAACLALARIGAREAAVGLRKLTRHPDPLPAAADNALGLLAMLGDSDYVRQSGMPTDPMEASGATNLGIVKTDEAGPILVKALDITLESSNHVRRMAAAGLSRLGNPDLARPMIDALTDPDPLVRRYAAEGLAAINHKPAIPFLLMALQANIASGNILRALHALTEGQDFGFQPRGSLVMREQAIERGFFWWGENHERLTGK